MMAATLMLGVVIAACTVGLLLSYLIDWRNGD